MPSPFATLYALKTHILDGMLVKALFSSALRLVAGYIMACILGIGFGIALSFTKEWAVGVKPFCLGLLSVPSIMFVPLLLVWFGPTNRAVIAVILIHATISMTLATLEGAAAMPRSLWQAARVLGANGTFFIRSVIIPAALPSLILGAQQAWAYAFRALLSGELLVKGAIGLGQALDKAKSHNDIPTMVAVLIVVGMFSQAVDAFVFRPLERRGHLSAAQA